MAMSAASSAVAGYPQEVVAGGPTSPKSLSSRPSRLRTRKKNKGRVHWDEQVIEEHNKERGTRQKIDEPDTPFVRSPQTASDSEGGPASSDDEHRLSYKASPKAGPSLVAPAPLQEQGGQKGDVDPLALASRLDNWVRSGGSLRRPSATSSGASSDGVEADVENSRVSSGCSSRSSSSAPPNRQATDGHHDHGSKNTRRISLSADAVQPKPTSDSFKAKRAQHYNEVAAMKAFKRHTSGESSQESDTSDEQEQTTTKTNTNTNINQTVAKSLETRPRHSSSGSENGQKANEEQKGGENRDRTVVISGESGGESSEEFRTLRHNHYSHEWRRDPDVPTTISSLETNTNTNLNAVSTAGVCRQQLGAAAKNPMEAQRPPVQFHASAGESASSSEDFRARRNEHYDEVKALRRFKSESQDELEKEAESSEDGQEGGSEAVANPANPMEPREPHVAFQVGGGSPVTEGSESRPGVQDGRGGSANGAEWLARRQAHYSEMAAALRAMPPPSDDEEEDEDE